MILLLAPLAAFLLAVTGWAVVHLIWQGALVGGLVAGVLALLRRAAPAVRERVALAGILALVLIFVGTLLRIGASGLLAAPPDPASVAMGPAMQVSALARLAAAFTRAFGPFAPFVGLAWLAFVAMRGKALFDGARRWRHLRRSGLPVLEGPAALACAHVARQMGVGRPVPILVTAAVEVPTVTGWRSPVILLPPAVATGFTAPDIADLVAHELGHVRRGDALTHVLQVVARILLFFHPVVHRLGRVVECEREQCCDDLAVAAGAPRLRYAHTLTRLERMRPRVAELAVAVNGAPLLGRVRRLVEPQQVVARRRALPLAITGILATAAVAAVAVASVRPATVHSGELRGIARHFLEERAGSGSQQDHAHTPVHRVRMRARARP